MGRGQSWRVALLSLVIASAAAAQSVSGVVVDSANHAPVRGAVVTMINATNQIVGRTVTNESGEYRFATVGGERKAHVVRIGFRPKDVELPVTEGAVRLDVVMVRLPTLLQPVRVLEQPKCERRSDRPAALALWEQTQSALLTAIVSRETNAGSLIRLEYHRVYDRNDRVVRQSVRVDSSDHKTDSFSAVKSAAEFVEKGFIADSAGTTLYFAPDAAVLLDDDFAAGYCFRILEPRRERPSQIGIGFDPSEHQRGRFEISGAAWIDTSARALRDVEFKYVGLERQFDWVAPGGNLEFREMPNGLTLIDRWMLRLVGVRRDTIRSPSAFVATRQSFFPEETGGELAAATWPTGAVFRQSLGSVRGTAKNVDGSSATGVRIELDDTDYHTTVDSTGSFEISNLLPGPYVVHVWDRRLAPLGITMPTRARFAAFRDSAASVSVTLPTLRTFILEQCAAIKRVSPGATALVLLRVEDPRGAPVARVEGRLTKHAPSGTRPEQMPEIASGVTNTDGLIPVCAETVNVGDQLDVTLQRPNARRTTTMIELHDDITVLQLRPRA